MIWQNQKPKSQNLKPESLNHPTPLNRVLLHLGSAPSLHTVSVSNARWACLMLRLTAREVFLKGAIGAYSHLGLYRDVDVSEYRIVEYWRFGYS